MSSFDLNSILCQMKEHGMCLPPERILIKLPESKKVLEETMRFFINLEGRNLIWLKEYDEVAQWLGDNNKRGLFLYGNCGRGKTILTRYALPAILLKYFRKIVSYFDVQEMNANLDSVLSKHIIALDDIGTEELTVSYGNKRVAFMEVIDAAEKRGKLLIISSNLGKDELIQKYGDRVFDRIVSTTKRVLFKGESLRK